MNDDENVIKLAYAVEELSYEQLYKFIERLSEHRCAYLGDFISIKLGWQREVESSINKGATNE